MTAYDVAEMLECFCSTDLFGGGTSPSKGLKRCHWPEMEAL